MAPRTWFLLVLLAALLACAGAAHAAAGADDDKVFACAECKESDTKKKCHQCKCPEWIGDKVCMAGCALKYPTCESKEGKCNDPKCSMPAPAEVDIVAPVPEPEQDEEASMMASEDKEDDKIRACAECDDGNNKKKCHECKCPEWLGDEGCKAGCALRYPRCQAKEGKCGDPKCAMPVAEIEVTEVAAPKSGSAATIGAGAAADDDDKVFACAECKESDTKKKCHQCKCPEWVGDMACKAGCGIKYPKCESKEGKCNDPKCSMPATVSTAAALDDDNNNDDDVEEKQMLQVDSSDDDKVFACAEC